MFSLVRRLIDRHRAAKRWEKLRAELDIGEGTRVFQSHIDSLFPHLIHIGRNCSFGPNSIVLTHDGTYFIILGEYKVAPVWIGDNVAVGYGVIIMPGVTIGSNVVIGAGSIVYKDVPSNVVVAGIPARTVATMEEYLKNRKPDQMFRPPYYGKPAAAVTADDIAAFRRMVYEELDRRKAQTAAL
jgi:maltose O-acetyltransferase